MFCPRCDKPMFPERFYGNQESFLGWHCLYCGEVIDSVILENRREGVEWRRKLREHKSS